MDDRKTKCVGEARSLREQAAVRRAHKGDGQRETKRQGRVTSELCSNCVARAETGGSMIRGLVRNRVSCLPYVAHNEAKDIRGRINIVGKRKLNKSRAEEPVAQ